MAYSRVGVCVSVCVCLVGCVLEQVLQVAGASPSGHRWDALIGRPGICQFLREGDGGQAGVERPGRLFVENRLGRGVPGVRCELRTPEQGGVLSGSRPGFPVLQLTGLATVLGEPTVSRVSGNGGNVSTTSLKSLIGAARVHGCCSRCSFLPHSAGAPPPSPTLVCHFLPPARTRPFWWLS